MDRKNKFLAVLVLMLVLIISITLVFSGCKRRARIVEALKERESERADTEEIIETEEVIEEDVTEEEVETEEVSEAQDESGEEVISEEEVSDDPGSESESDEEIIEEEVVEESIDEEEQSESVEQYTTEIPFVAGECGNIIGGVAYSDPVIYPGDNGSEDHEVRGFVSFDISSLAGATVVEADISANADNLFGTPFNTYGPLLVKAVYWGPREIMPSDYDLDGVELRNVTNKNFGIQNKNLKEDFQRAIDNGSGRYQLIFYFEMSGTDGDGEADNITYYLDEIIFTVTYNQ